MKKIKNILTYTLAAICGFIILLYLWWVFGVFLLAVAFIFSINTIGNFDQDILDQAFLFFIGACICGGIGYGEYYFNLLYFAK